MVYLEVNHFFDVINFCQGPSFHPLWAATATVTSTVAVETVEVYYNTSYQLRLNNGPHFIADVIKEFLALNSRH